MKVFLKKVYHKSMLLQTIRNIFKVYEIQLRDTPSLKIIIK